MIIELINLRHRRAKLLGFDSHASYVVNSCMAKYVEEVERFLLTLTGKWWMYVILGICCTARLDAVGDMLSYSNKKIYIFL